MHEDLIKRLRELQAITEHCDEQSCGECENRELCDKHDNKTLSGTYKEAADAIEELQKLTDAQLDIIKQYQAYLDKMRWVPVTERLPEENGRYLVRYVRDIDLKGGVHSDEVIIMRFVDAQWRFPFICNPDVRKFVTREKVTHWMPLPPAPEEGEI